MIELRNIARVKLPDDPSLKALILGMYSYTNSYTGESFCNYIYKDGVVYLPPNVSKLEVVAGLLGEEIVDCRSVGAPLKEPFVLRDEFTFRGYQVEPAKQLVDYSKNYKYATLQGATGVGKTLVMTYAYGMLGGKGLILIDQSNLAPSWIDAASLVWGKKVQKIKAGDTTFADICLVTFQLLARNEELLRAVSKEFMTTVIDECHISAAESYKRVLSHLDNAHRIACSASYLRKGFGGQVLSDFLAPVSVILKNDKALIPEIHWVDTDVVWPASDPMQYANTILPYLADDMRRNSIILKLAKESANEGRAVAVICITVKQATFINELLNRSGVKSTLYTGNTSMKRDREVKELLESGKISAVACCGKLRKGTDWVNLSTLILCKPDNSEVNAIQVVGRVSRVLEGKPQPIVYDLRDKGSLAEAFAKGRLRYYKKLGYIIK